MNDSSGVVKFTAPNGRDHSEPRTGMFPRTKNVSAIAHYNSIVRHGLISRAKDDYFSDLLSEEAQLSLFREHVTVKEIDGEYDLDFWIIFPRVMRRIASDYFCMHKLQRKCHNLVASRFVAALDREIQRCFDESYYVQLEMLVYPIADYFCIERRGAEQLLEVQKIDNQTARLVKRLAIIWGINAGTIYDAGALKASPAFSNVVKLRDFLFRRSHQSD